MISVTVDGKRLLVRPGTTVMEAALAGGIDIPRLCYHPELRPSGGCRLCLVEVAGKPTSQPSCGLYCEDGMVVRTESEALTALRREVVDLLVSDHPLRCAVCDKNGACDLQKYAYRYGVAETSYVFGPARGLVQDDNPFFIRDHELCILCGKCVRICDEVVGANAIDFAGRGFTSHVATPFDRPLGESACVFCGSCVQVCPTAALLPKSRLRKGREWELERKRTVCGYCGVGCRLEYALKDGQILYAQGYPEAPVNGELLCVKGRFGWDWVSSPERLTTPLARREVLEAWQHRVGESEGGSVGDAASSHALAADFVPISWNTALDLVASKLATTVRRYGPDAVALLASARCTNEENYLFQKLARASLGTNNVDHCARLCHASSVTGLGLAFGSGAMTNPIRDIRDADCILITGSNTAESHPVIGYEVVRAVKKGASLIVIDPRRVPLADHATLHLRPAPGTDGHVFLAMAHVILREGWADPGFIATRTEGFVQFIESIAMQTPEAAALASGVPAELIVEAARRYALGERAGREPWGTEADIGPDPSGVNHQPAERPGPSPEARGRSTILYAMGITQRSNGTELVLSLANLALLCGQVGQPSTGLNPLRGQANVQGACDVGALPDLLPGYRRVADDEARRAVAGAWGLDDLPDQPGLTVVEMTQAATEGRVRAMYVMGENPLLSDPNLAHVEAGLRSLDFLVVQDIFLSETAQLAHVVLPAASSLEKDGTFTNTERRVQLLEPVLAPPGEAWPDWRIVCALGRRLDARLGRAGDWSYPSTAAVMRELAATSSIYGGIRHERLSGRGLVWPCPTPEHPGTPVLHVEAFTRGRGRFHAVEPRPPAEQADDQYPLILTTGRLLAQYHTGTMTRRSAGLAWREPGASAEVNPLDAAAIGLADGDEVVIRGRRGAVQVRARLTERVPAGLVFLSFHWKEAPANLLTQDFALDPLAKIPEYKVCAVRLEAVHVDSARR